jgi:hypothetical protein
MKRWLRIAIASTSEHLDPPYLFWREALSLLLNLCCSFCVIHFVYTYLNKVRLRYSSPCKTAYTYLGPTNNLHSANST